MLAYEIVIWLILGGLWIWLQLWNFELTKINKQLRKRICQLEAEQARHQSKPSQTNRISVMSPSAFVEQLEEVNNTPSPT